MLEPEIASVSVHSLPWHAYGIDLGETIGRSGCAGVTPYPESTDAEWPWGWNKG